MYGQSDTQDRRSLGSRRLGWLEYGYIFSETALAPERTAHNYTFKRGRPKPFMIRSIS